MNTRGLHQPMTTMVTDCRAVVRIWVANMGRDHMVAPRVAALDMTVGMMLGMVVTTVGPPTFRGTLGTHGICRGISVHRTGEVGISITQGQAGVLIRDQVCSAMIRPRLDGSCEHFRHVKEIPTRL